MKFAACSESKQLLQRAEEIMAIAENQERAEEAMAISQSQQLLQRAKDLMAMGRVKEEMPDSPLVVAEPRFGFTSSDQNNSSDEPDDEDDKLSRVGNLTIRNCQNFIDR